MRAIFMSGALHLFNYMMTILDSEPEEIEADARRMELIANELGAFQEELVQRVARAKGSA